MTVSWLRGSVNLIPPGCLGGYCRAKIIVSFLQQSHHHRVQDHKERSLSLSLLGDVSAIIVLNNYVTFTRSFCCLSSQKCFNYS